MMKLLRSLKVRMPLGMLGMFALLLVFAHMAHAVDLSSFDATSAAFPIYDFIVNSLIKGPIGVVAGILCIGLGFVNIAGRGQFVMGIAPLIAGIGMLKLDAIVGTFGALIC